MFNNVGKVIKSIAEVLFIIQVIIYLILGIICLSTRMGFLLFLIIIILGVAISYISCLFLAAIGELIETNRMTAESNKRILDILSSKQFAVSKQSEPLKSEGAKQKQRTEMEQKTENKKESGNGSVQNAEGLKGVVRYVVNNSSDYKSVSEIKKFFQQNGIMHEDSPEIYYVLEHFIKQERLYGPMVESVCRKLKEIDN